MNEEVMKIDMKQRFPNMR
ncbi:hypothetical protein Golax_021631 [Gossypium laxum]|uniref:Uncharacterized protein n=1 Tax=Gossypium laxum TaxID=34288 RepID=A0A7J9ANL4_9ROSI|nr:hypothetical protein [Gossypium laxum]